MAVMSTTLAAATSAILLFALTVSGVNGQACTADEQTSLFSCLAPYNANFNGMRLTPPCDRSEITPSLCSDFGNIVTCANGKTVSDTCAEGAKSQFNDNVLQIACKIEDFEATCTDAPKLNVGSGGSSNVKSGPGVVVASLVLASAVLFRS